MELVTQTSFLDCAKSAYAVKPYFLHLLSRPRLDSVSVEKDLGASSIITSQKSYVMSHELLVISYLYEIYIFSKEP